MGRIKLLDEATINKIAAGEVIEKPASIVKELVENSIDAGATAISVEITEGGKSFISVSDNGCGISEEDLGSVFERHATSKIEDSDDLFSILTLGFRGEAMASIAAVSEVELKTKSEEDTSGYYMLVKGGNILEKNAVGLPVGTSITVRNLFFNTPARLKFLKSDISEQGYIVDIVEKLALSNTAISFKLTVNNKPVLHTPGNGDMLSVIHCIYGKNIAKSMLPLDYKSEHITIDGYIGKPEIAKGNSTFIILSVNNRVIKNRMLIEAVRQAYKTMLMNNKFPFAILNININTDKIDVNVHPTKAEIKFTDERAIFNTLYVAIRNCLNTSDLTFGTIEPDIPKAVEAPAVNQAERVSEEKDRYVQQRMTEDIIPSNIGCGIDKKDFNTTSRLSAELFSPKRPEAFPEPEIEVIKKPCITNSYKVNNDLDVKFDNDNRRLPDLQIVGQLFKTYILAQSGDSFYMIDQHAAHERITYEYLMDKYDTGDITIQQLLLPLVLELSPKETALLTGNFLIFQKLGFELEWFGDNTIAIRSIPIIMGEPCSGEFFSDILSTIEGESKQLDAVKEKIIISMSCKNSIKAGDSLSLDEINELVSRLGQTKSPFTCPHGRPTIITMTNYELEKKFKRII